MADTKIVTWMPEPSEKCDLCHQPIIDRFIDGKTRLGPWGCICPTCHALEGFGLGPARGQLYEKQLDDKWLKIAG